ncbi:MAG TPA: hypothetical protein GXX26_09710 [Clostridiaceae bacterium]|jgi:hypothetical protein|nr:hypothetical protein [Clostridiaceae bacterium]
MADELDKKLKQIADMFGVSDTSGLKNIVESIAPQSSGSGSDNPVEQSYSSNTGSTGYTPPQAQHGNIDYGILSKASEMLSMFNNVSDSRINLLNSVQPFLGNQRRQRLNGAIQLLKVINVLSSIRPQINRNTKG